VMRIAAATTVLALGAFIVVMVRHEKRRMARGSIRSAREGRVRPELVQGRSRN
jgi:hypothetical protein